jgi:uncharacterized protein YggU (UPF0235/DUF167 family)
VEFYICVTPNAKKKRINISENGVKVYLTAPAVDGKANKALIEFLAEYVGCARNTQGAWELVDLEDSGSLFDNRTILTIRKNQISITKGLKSRDKTITIVGLI